jgi:rSAM/selenodomain-associated transferase 1
MNKDLLIIFTRNPELGKVKTRLSSRIGNDAALRIYKFLLKHTAEITKELKVVKEVCYSEKIKKDDIWDTDIYSKKLQKGTDLGERMHHAFKQGFNEGYTHIIIIGSDMYELSKEDLEAAFRSLMDHDYIIGPAKDGGYYLLGMKRFTSELFKNKNWGTDTVLQATLNDLKKESMKLLPVRNDVDYFEDIQHIDVFKQFL